MKAKLIKEWGGIGTGTAFSSGMSRGGQINRGGFGGSNVGGSHSMYTYEIKDLNRALQPDVDNAEEPEQLHDGNKVKGQQLNKRDGKEHIGILLRTQKAENGSLNYYVILDNKSGILMKLDPTTTSLISGINDVDPATIIPGDDPDEMEEEKVKISKSTQKDKSGRTILMPKLIKGS